MAGCFGNHPVDRWMESQLFHYLDSCADDEDVFLHWCEAVSVEDWDRFEPQIEKIYDRYIGPRLWYGRMTLEQAQRLLIRFVNKLKRELT